MYRRVLGGHRVCESDLGRVFDSDMAGLARHSEVDTVLSHEPDVGAEGRGGGDRGLEGDTSFLLFGRIRRLVILPSLVGCTTRVPECANNATNNTRKRGYIYLLHPLSLSFPPSVSLSPSLLSSGAKSAPYPRGRRVEDHASRFTPNPSDVWLDT